MTDEATNEARAIAFTNVKTPKGYWWSFTMRCDSVKDLVTQIEDMEAVFEKKNWEAQELRASFNKFPKKEVELVPDMKCPTCGSGVIKGKTKDGKDFYKCSTQKFNFTTKEVTGCPYFAWVARTTPAQDSKEDTPTPPDPDLPF